MVTFYTANGLVQEQEVIDDVGILLSDLGIGAVIHQGLDGALDGGAQLLVIGAERPRLANASSEVKFASAPPSSGAVKSVLPSTIAPAFTASRLASGTPRVWIPTRSILSRPLLRSMIS